MKRFFSGLMTISLVFALGACGDAGGTKRDAVRTAKQKTAFVSSEDGKTYTSTFLDLSMIKPDNWISENQAYADKIMNIGTDMAAGDDRDFKAELDLSLQNSLAICIFSRYPSSEGRTDNALVMGVSENVRLAPEVKTGADYFDQMKLLANNSAVSIHYSDTYGETMIDGQTFGTMVATYEIDGMEVQPQQYYATRHKDHVIVFITTYSNPEDRQAAEGIIDSIKLDW